MLYSKVETAQKKPQGRIQELRKREDTSKDTAGIKEGKLVLGYWLHRLH